MKILVLAAIALFPLAVAAQRRCPELPSSASVHWESHHGPDFDACYALNKDGSLAFGLYRGNTPPLLADSLTRAEVGTVAGKPVRWYANGPERSYQAELFLGTSADDSIRVFVPRQPAGTFRERVKLVGALSMEQTGAP